MRLTSIFVVLAAAVLISACDSKKVDNSMIVDPGDDGDPGATISYATEVQPIFNQSCAGFGCHVGESTNGVNLSSHAQALASRGIQYGGAVILAGNGAGSPLINKVNPNPTHGSRMPLGKAPLSGSQINTIRTWIDQGAANN